jgi:hypothetical protein
VGVGPAEDTMILGGFSGYVTYLYIIQEREISNWYQSYVPRIKNNHKLTCSRLLDQSDW